MDDYREISWKATQADTGLSMESFGNTPVFSKRVKVETQSEWSMLCRGSTTAKQQNENGESIEGNGEENTRKKLDISSSEYTPELSQCPISLLISTGSQTSRNSLVVPNEVLGIILRHVFGQCPRAFLYCRDPSILRFVGDLSALDTSIQFRQVTLSILFENMEVIGQDLLAGPIRELSPRYFHTVSALTIGCESLELFDDFAQGAKLFTGLKSLHLKLDLQLPENHSFWSWRAWNRSYHFRLLGWFDGKNDTIKNLLEKYSGDMTPKLTVQMTVLRCDGPSLEMLIKDRIMYVEGPVRRAMAQFPLILMLSEALSIPYHIKERRTAAASFVEV